MWISGCPGIVCWKDCSFPTKNIWHPCQVEILFSTTSQNTWGFLTTHSFHESVWTVQHSYQKCTILNVDSGIGRMESERSRIWNVYLMSALWLSQIADREQLFLVILGWRQGDVELSAEGKVFQWLIWVILREVWRLLVIVLGSTELFVRFYDCR